MSEFKQIPSAANYIATISQTSLPISVPGDKNRISFTKPLPIPIAKATIEGEVWGRLGCRGQLGEWVKIRKGSYSSQNFSAEIIRGASGYYDGSIGEVIDFTGQNDLELVIGEILPPSIVQQMADSIFDDQDLSGLPVAKVNAPGVVQVGYRSADQATNIASTVVPTDAPAHLQLYKAVYGKQSTAGATLTVTTEEIQRAEMLGQLIGLFASRPSNYEKAQEMIALFADDKLYTNFKKFLNLIKDDAKYTKLNDLLK